MTLDYIKSLRNGSFLVSFIIILNISPVMALSSGNFSTNNPDVSVLTDVEIQKDQILELKSTIDQLEDSFQVLDGEYKEMQKKNYENFRSIIALLAIVFSWCIKTVGSETRLMSKELIHASNITIFVSGVYLLVSNFQEIIASIIIILLVFFISIIVSSIYTKLKNG